MAETESQLKLRLPREMKEAIEASAKKSRRTINSEVVFMLEQILYSEPRKVIYTVWHPVELQDRYDTEKEFMEHNDAVRMACSDYISKFFQRHPTYKLISFEFKKRTNRKGKDVLYGVRIWYSYPDKRIC